MTELIHDRDDLLDKIHSNDMDINSLKGNIEVHLELFNRLDRTVESLRDLAEATHTLISVHDTRLNSLDGLIQDNKVDGKALIGKLSNIEDQIQSGNSDKAVISEKLDRLDDKLHESELDRKTLNLAVAILNTRIENRLIDLERPIVRDEEKESSLKWLIDNWRVIGIVILVAADLIFDVTNHKVGYLFRLLIGSS